MLSSVDGSGCTRVDVGCLLIVVGVVTLYLVWRISTIYGVAAEEFGAYYAYPPARNAEGLGGRVPFPRRISTSSALS